MHTASATFTLCRVGRGGIKTGESFEFEGLWWIPSDEPDHMAQGTLRYTPSDGATLVVVDLYGDPGQSINSPAKLSVLHGETLKGKPCTLFNLVSRHTETTIGAHSRAVLGSNFLVYGGHLSSPDDLSIERARIGLRGLGEWLTEPWPGRETSFENLAGEGVVEIPLDGARLIFQEERHDTSERFSRVRAIRFSALFEFDEPKTLTDLNEKYIRPLHDLLVLGTNEEIRVNETTILESEEMEKWWGDQEPIKHTREVAVIQKIEHVWHAEKKNAFRQVPLPLAALGSDPIAAIPRWYALRAELAGAGNSLFATLNRRFRTLEIDLLSLLSVAEGYHRARFDVPVVSKETHQAAVRAMVDVLPDELKENYEKRLGHADEQTQAQRLRELFDKAESAVPELKKWRKLVHGLVQTRNFLTHWGDKSDDVLSIDGQILALKKLEIVLRINLMLDMEIDPGDIQGSINVSHGEHEAFDSS